MPFSNMLTQDYVPENLFEADLIPAGLLANMIEYTDSVYMVFTPVQMKVEDQMTVGKVIASMPGCVVIDPMFYTSEMVKTIKDDFNIALNISMAYVFVVLLCSLKNSS